MVWFKKYENRIVWLLAAIFFVVVFGLCLLKYLNYQYNALDLAIFSDVLNNTAHGQWFHSAIQQHNYFADHFSPILMFIAPLYLLVNSPIILLIIQTLFLALGGVFLWHLAKDRLPMKMARLLVGVYYLCPLIWNASLYEFSTLCFLPALFFGLVRCHQRKMTWGYGAFLILLLLLREDIALLTVMFGVWLTVFHWKEKEDRWYGLITMIVSGGWFFMAMGLTSWFNHGYRFASYYDNIFKNIINLSQFDLILGLLLPFGFLPLLKPSKLLVLLLVLLEFVFLGGAGGQVLQTHYSLLFTPVLFWVLVDVLTQYEKPIKFWQELIPFILMAGVVYSGVMIGPWLCLNKVFRPAAERMVIKRLLSEVPKNAPIVASSTYLAYLSNNHVYAGNYVFLGHQQMSSAQYQVPTTIDYVLLDDDDRIFMELNYGDHPVYKNEVTGGDLRLRQILKDFTLRQRELGYSLHVSNRLHPTEMTCLYTVEFNVTPGFYQLEYGNQKQLMVSNFESPATRCLETSEDIKITPVKLTGMTVANRVSSSENIFTIEPMAP